jgi:leucyl/phenylalanyl-tRNA---protein transferase
MISRETLLAAYRHGWFPMGDAASGRVEWFSPDPRGILPLEGYRPTRRLLRTVQQQRFAIRVNTAFADVILACADRQDTWITPDIVSVYRQLHADGFAHSVEAWRGGVLAGGLYGVSLGGAFFGESMFHRERDASKVALHALVMRLRARGFELLDVQWLTPHLEQFGAIEVRRRDYLRRLAVALARACPFM